MSNRGEGGVISLRGRRSERSQTTARELAHLSDEALAQDAVQEAFLGVWRAAGRFTAERAKPSTWLLTLVHRRAVDLVRREQRRRTEPLQPDSASTDSAPDELELLSERQSIREALRKLPPEQREAIELAYY